MNQADVRRWHHRLGIALAIFIVLQGGSGLLITLSEWKVSHSHADERHAHETGHPMEGDETMGHHSEMDTAHEGHSDPFMHIIRYHHNRSNHWVFDRI